MLVNTKPAAVRLRRNYDVKRLLADLEACERAHREWVTHEQVLEGKSAGWNVLPIRSRGGSLDDACARPNRPEPFQDTPLFKHAPYVREIVAGLESAVSSIRFSALHPGGRIYEHSDGPGFELGTAAEIRLHIPVATNDDVWFVVDKERYPLRAGEVWYGDFTKLHWVENRGTEPRIHLTIDTRVSSTLLGLFPEEYLVGLDVKVDQPFSLSAGLRRALEFSFELGGVDGELERALEPLPQDFRDLLKTTFGGQTETRWVDGKLWAMVAGQPTFPLEVESETRVRVAYQPAALQLELQNGVPVQGTLELNVFGQAFKLPLRVNALS
jgi:hypothetical protein